MIRPMGRLRKPGEPSSTAALPQAASAPANSRKVVAELPQFKLTEGRPALGSSPTPCTVSVVRSSRQRIPSAVNASSIASVTPETRKLHTWLSPSAIAANNAARWESDLSPGRAAGDAPGRAAGAAPGRTGTPSAPSSPSKACPGWTVNTLPGLCSLVDSPTSIGISLAGISDSFHF